MRSTLIPLLQNCELKNKCKNCGQLGYEWNHKSISCSQVLESSIYNPTERYIVPCVIHPNSEQKSLIENLKRAGKQVGYVLSFERWSMLSFEEQNSFAEKDLAIIFHRFSDLKHLHKSKNSYFLISKKEWSFEQWKSLASDIQEKLTYFFLPNSFRNSDEFSADEIFEITKSIRLVNPNVNFNFPFGHDALDSRNPRHLAWNLIPSLIKKNSQDENKIKISIIIPFYDRSDFVRKVLAQLAKQTLLLDDFEIILVDDGSSKYHKHLVHEILKEFSKIQYTYLYVDRDMSLTKLYVGNRAGPARNLGTSFARGEILLFLDSDILLPQDYLAEIFREHQLFEVVMPKRVYLSKEYSAGSEFDLTRIEKSHLFHPQWQEYIKEFYRNKEWSSEKLPWKYFITYCLSIKRDLFFRSGGFRTNYISFGYEDLDLGFRISRLNPQYKIIDKEVYHLYHFDSGFEYTLDMDNRFFQLATTAKTFLIQNTPDNAEYLPQMARLKNFRQKLLFFYFSVLWKMNGIFNSFSRAAHWPK